METDDRARLPVGVFAMIDALGFKGVWSRPEVADPRIVIENLRKLQDAAVKEAAIFGGPVPEGSPKSGLELAIVTLLSDTVVLGIAPGLPPLAVPSDRRLSLALCVVSQMCARIMSLAAAQSPGLAYRGCITVGEFAGDDRFFVGPAVDEVAERMDRAQGGFVWLTDKARQLVLDQGVRYLGKSRNTTSSGAHMPLDCQIVEYDVPMKNGASAKTFAVSPFAREDDDGARQTLLARIIDTFNVTSAPESRKEDVIAKRANTQSFLDFARVKKF